MNSIGSQKDAQGFKNAGGRAPCLSLRPNEDCRAVACEGGLLTRPIEECRAVAREGGPLSTTYDKPTIRASVETKSRKIEKGVGSSLISGRMSEN